MAGSLRAVKVAVLRDGLESGGIEGSRRELLWGRRHLGERSLVFLQQEKEGRGMVAWTREAERRKESSISKEDNMQGGTEVEEV